MLTRRFAIAAAICLAATQALPQSGQKGLGSGSSNSPAPAQAYNIAGNYTAQGRNPDGSDYTGQVQVTQRGTDISFTWRIGNDTTNGRGLIDGRIVAVDWGSDTPVVYVVMPDGELHGTWDDGRALEKLTPR